MAIRIDRSLVGPPTWEPATTRATRAGLQSVRSKPALFLARGIRSGGLATGPAGWGRTLSAPDAVVRLSVPALTEQSRCAGRAPAQPLGTASQRHGRPRRPAGGS